MVSRRSGVVNPFSFPWRRQGPRASMSLTRLRHPPVRTAKVRLPASPIAGPAPICRLPPALRAMLSALPLPQLTTRPFDQLTRLLPAANCPLPAILEGCHPLIGSGGGRGVTHAASAQLAFQPASLPARSKSRRAGSRESEVNLVKDVPHYRRPIRARVVRAHYKDVPRNEASPQNNLHNCATPSSRFTPPPERGPVDPAICFHSPQRFTIIHCCWDHRPHGEDSS